MSRVIQSMDESLRHLWQGKAATRFCCPAGSKGLNMSMTTLIAIAAILTISISYAEAKDRSKSLRVCTASGAGHPSHCSR
jgi:hypothetical protein